MVNTAAERTQRAKTFWLRNDGGRTLNLLKIRKLKNNTKFYQETINSRWFIGTFASYWWWARWSFFGLWNFLSLQQGTHFNLNLRKFCCNVYNFRISRKYSHACVKSLVETWFFPTPLSAPSLLLSVTGSFPHSPFLGIFFRKLFVLKYLMT